MGKICLQLDLQTVLPVDYWKSSHSWICKTLCKCENVHKLMTFQTEQAGRDAWPLPAVFYVFASEEMCAGVHQQLSKPVDLVT